MAYLIAFQLLCGCFAGYVAAQKHRNWFWWFLVGALVPVVGVLFALAVDTNRSGGSGFWTNRNRDQDGKPKRPRRCCGSYIPDCEGCPYFRRPLFDQSFEKDKKGYCEFFEKDLVKEEESGKGRVIIRGERDED